MKQIMICAVALILWAPCVIGAVTNDPKGNVAMEQLDNANQINIAGDSDQAKSAASEQLGDKSGTGAIVVPGKQGKNKDQAKNDKVENTVSETPNKKTNLTAVPSLGPNKPVKEPNTDPNRWNATIMGGKGAIYAGLLGLIFSGPVGMLLCGAIGFVAAYYMYKQVNS